MYACLKCGFIHKGETKRVRVERKKSHVRFVSILEFHGYITYRKCPKCEYKQQIKVEED